MLGLTTLYYRRLRVDVIQVKCTDLFHFNTRPSRYNSVRLIKPRALTQLLDKTVFHRAASC